MSTRGFTRLLIANRGEIALRVMRTAGRLGLRCIAVYSQADRAALHVRQADQAEPIGAAPARDSYLNIAAIIAAAQRSGAQAVHPGYGFLAENAAFAQAVLDAGLTWVGPPPAAMRAMAHKAEAKRRMAAAGVPCVPGYLGEDQAEARLISEARRIGFPLMIKAAAGGGGRGLRRVETADDLGAALRSARSEAEQAFADGDLLLERALLAPRHIEVQVFADAHGQVVHLGERDCSVQRRHQKLIEEAPAPGVSADLRARIGAAAVAATRAIDYRGAGTLEFLLDADGAFYFMEMNTRLQVEHAVTEALVGVDLVEWQLRIAAGEPLPLDQAQIDARFAGGGHAIEVRLCAEDPAQAFLPQSGTVLRWQAPPGVRVEHALTDGSEVPPHYDSMLAKLIAHGSDREAARLQLIAALDASVLLGVRCNRRFLRDCLAHPAFAAGGVGTDFITRHASTLMADAVAPELLALAAVQWQQHRLGPRARRYPGEWLGWSNVAREASPLCFDCAGVRQRAELRQTAAASWRVQIGLATFSVERMDAEGTRWSVDGQELHCATAASADRLYLHCAGVELELAAPRVASGATSSDGRVRAPMNGRVVAVETAIGAYVGRGAALLTIEAMKMEHVLRAERAGRVSALHVAIGDQVAPGRVLVEIDADAAG